MIWILIIIGLFLLSLALSFRSMHDFQESPHKKITHGLFLVRNMANFNQDFLEDLKARASVKPRILAFEKVIKGPHQAILMYGPHSFIEQFPELNLLELEDYTDRLIIQEITAEELTLKSKQESQVNIEETFLNKVPLDGEDELFLQIVCRFIPAQSNLFASTIRVLVKAPTPASRSDIMRDVNFRMSHVSNLIKRIFPRSSEQLFKDYKLRSFYPEENSRLYLTDQQIVTLLGV